MPPARSRLAQRESTRQARAANEGSQISGTAIAFLVPLFLFFIFGPITLVVIIKRRRRNNEAPAPVRARGRITGRPKKITREQARKILNGCTGIVKVGERSVVAEKEAGGEGSLVENDIAKDGTGGEADAGSVLERECAICLTTLYGPPPPSPAKLPIKIAAKPETESAAPVTDRSEDSEQEVVPKAEEILRLNVCTHEFHAECLTGWFIFGKFSCPICRAVFYGTAKEEGKEEGESSETQTEASQRGNSQSRLPPIAEEEEAGRDRRREEV